MFLTGGGRSTTSCVQENGSVSAEILTTTNPGPGTRKRRNGTAKRNGKTVSIQRLTRHGRRLAENNTPQSAPGATAALLEMGLARVLLMLAVVRRCRLAPPSGRPRVESARVFNLLVESATCNYMLSSHWFQMSACTTTTARGHGSSRVPSCRRCAVRRCKLDPSLKAPRFQHLSVKKMITLLSI